MVAARSWLVLSAPQSRVFACRCLLPLLIRYASRARNIRNNLRLNNTLSLEEEVRQQCAVLEQRCCTQM